METGSRVADASISSAAPLESHWTRGRTVAASAALLAIYGFFSCYHLSDIPLLDPDEPRYAAAGRTMAQGGSWLIPEFNGEPRINKPPLFYWLVALSDLVCGGASEVSARLPSIVMGLAMLAMTVWAGARLYGPATGFLAGIILATSPLFIALSRGCVTDQTFSTLLSAALFCYLLGLAGAWPGVEVRASGAGGWPFASWQLATGALAGTAFMTKGTATLLVLIIPLLFFGVFCRNGLRAWWHGKGWGLPMLLAAALAAWWYVVLYLNAGHDHFVNLLKVEIVNRLSGKMHEEPPVYFLYTLPAIFFPWSVTMLPAMWVAWRRVDLNGPRGGMGGGGDVTLGVKAVADAFLVAWVLGVVVFFSIPGAKLASYVLPAFPALALLAARFMLRLKSADEPLSARVRYATLILPVVLAIGAGLFLMGAFGLKKDVQNTLNDVPIPQWAIALLVAAATVVPWFLLMVTRRPALTVGLLVCFLVGLTVIALPRGLDPINRRSSKQLALKVFDEAQQVARCVSLGSDEESLVYYLNRPVKEARRPDPLKNETYSDVIRETVALEPPGKLLMFVHQRYFQLWMKDQPPEGTREVTRNQHIVVLLNAPP